MIKRSTKLLVLLSSIFIVASCGSDPYYHDYVDRGFRRIPLLKSSQMMHYDRQFWVLCKGQDCSYYSTDWNIDINSKLLGVVDSLSVIDTIIVAKLGTRFFEYYLVETWNIMIPSIDYQRIFLNDSSFHEELKKFTKSEPEFRSCDDVWREFVDKGYLDWFPEEEKYKPFRL